MAENLSPIAYEAAVDNFNALAEAMGGREADYLSFESTDGEKLEEMVTNCENGVFLVLLGGGDVEVTRHSNKLYISEPRTDEDWYEYIHSFVIIKTEEEGVQCFHQFPGGMDSDKELFSVGTEFWSDLQHLTAHSRAGVVPKTFQRLFCGSVEPSPALLPPHDTMIVKALAY
mmetsp:Transcript_46932/g.109722  ORF Transcript_46932/g.109722 Transcript_46932/m.109722 type:complete len:172 (-) Transcript_46932:131-646(-)